MSKKQSFTEHSYNSHDTKIIWQPELVLETKRYLVDTVELASVHSLCYGATFLERGWTLFNSGVALGERQFKSRFLHDE